jgi:hypothetical protein
MLNILRGKKNITVINSKLQDQVTFQNTIFS